MKYMSIAYILRAVSKKTDHLFTNTYMYVYW